MGWIKLESFLTFKAGKLKFKSLLPASVKPVVTCVVEECDPLSARTKKTIHPTKNAQLCDRLIDVGSTLSSKATVKAKGLLREA